MKGLLLKDYYLTKNNRRLLGIVIFLPLIFLFAGYNPMFIISYITFIATSMAVSTISLDTFDQSVGFLLTLPVYRKTYVKEKYLFGFCTIAAGWMLAMIFAAGYRFFHGHSVFHGELLLPAGMTLYLSAFLLMLMIPVQLKFGGENGKLVMFALIVAVLITGSLLFQALEGSTLPSEEFLHRFFSLPAGALLFFLAAVFGIGLWISMQVSFGIFRKKEY